MLKDIEPILNRILYELAQEIFVSENRHRYQQEQKMRYHLSEKKFNTFFNRNSNLDSFIVKYNLFIRDGIEISHNHYSPKIEANYRRNYHDGEVSPVTSLIFYLYFKTGKVHKFLSKVLSAAYRNPYTDRQSRTI